LIAVLLFIPPPVLAVIKFQDGWNVTQAAPNIAFSVESVDGGKNNELVFTLLSNSFPGKGETIVVTSVGVPKGTFGTMPQFRFNDPNAPNGSPFQETVSIKEPDPAYSKSITFTPGFFGTQPFDAFPNARGDPPLAPVTVTFKVQGSSVTPISPFTLTFP
jgi:hypothetical protein